jgi:hypothetical protein
LGGGYLDWVSSIVTKLDNYNEGGSGSVVLFFENLSVNICRFKKYFNLRGGAGGAGPGSIVLKYHADLEGCKGIQQICFDARLQCFKYAFLIAALDPNWRKPLRKS